MASQAYMVIVHDDGHPTQVILPDGRIGVLFPRASDEGMDIFYGEPEIGADAVFHKTADGKERFIFGGFTVEEARKELTNPDSNLHQPGAEGWELVERTTVTFW